MHVAILSLVALFASVSVTWAARPGDFQVIGQGGGGAMFYPTISPHNPDTALIACDMTGAYITHDGGKSWRMFNLRGTATFFAFDPIAANTIYVGGDGLWRSTDGGESWKLLYPKPSTIQRIQMESDHSDETIVAEPNSLGKITALAIDPSDSRTLYAAGGGVKDPALFVSRDFGESWYREVSLTEASRHIWVDPHSSRASRTLFLGGARSVMVIAAGAVKSLPAPSGTTFTDMSLGFDARPKPIIYGASTDGVFVSSDGGGVWTKCILPGAGSRVRAVATSLHHPGTVYLSYSSLKLDGQAWLGVAKSADSGQTWQLMWKESAAAAPNIHDVWITPHFGPGWAENPLMLGVAEQDANLCYGTDFGRAMLTADGGVNWNAVYSRSLPGGGSTTTGLDVTTSYGFHFDPFDANRQFITYTDIGLFRSEDGGKSWSSSSAGVPPRWTNTTYWMEFDPKVRGRVWNVNSATHDLPRPKMWRHNSVLKYKGGVCRSDDGGRTWVKSSNGMDETAATHILLDPSSPVDARVLYVAAFGRGVYKSSDGGGTWVLKNKGITPKEPFAWRLARGGDGTLYLLVARRSEDGSIGNAGDGALYKSTDGAESWSVVTLPAGVNAPNGLAIDPKSNHRLYLAAWARSTGVHGEGGGIYVSDDGGGTWHQVLDRDRHIYDVTLDPRDPNKLYATGFESSAWRSVDHGEHWTRIPGFNFKWGHRVVPDPENPMKVYVTTFGGGVWHGSVNGVPGPVDIVTPELDPGR